MDDPLSVAEIADALRLIRTRERLSQTAASRLDGAPDFRTLSHWETCRKQPSLRLLARYLRALGLDFHDLQDALDQVGEGGTTAERIAELAGQIDRLARAVEDLGERRQVVLERRSAKTEALIAESANELARLVERLDRVDELAERVDRIERRLGPGRTETIDSASGSGDPDER